jgi:hypothetical protein
VGEIPAVCKNSFISGDVMIIELLGIVATLFVLVSFLMKDAARIRKINIIGAMLFVIYGLLIGSISVWLLNGVLCVVHILYLKQGK